MVGGRLSLLLVTLSTALIAAPFVNPGFESGLDGWTSTGSVVATGTQDIWVTPSRDWHVTPNGTSMAVLNSSYGIPVAQLDSFIGAAPGMIEGIVPGAFSGSLIYQDVVVAAGESVSLYWAFVTTDCCEFNDTAFVVALDPSSPGGSTLAAVSSGAPYVVGALGATGWHEAVFSPDESGTYRLVIGVANVVDDAGETFLFLDDGPGTLALQTPEPLTAGLLGIGLACLALLRRRR